MFGCLITTIAGGAGADLGDGGLATEARLDQPTDVLVGPDGSLFVADNLNNRIRHIDAAGLIDTIAGTGSAVQHAPIDGRPGIETILSRPTGLAFGPDGSLYFCDVKFHIVRRIGPGGIVTTVAGGSDPLGPVRDGGPARLASLFHPSDVVFDSQGDLYIADTSHHRIRRVDIYGRITTIAGTGEAGSTGDSGPATEARLSNPESLAYDPKGFLYVGHGGPIRRIDLSTGSITSIGETGGASYLTLAPNGDLYFSLTGGHLVGRVGSGGGWRPVAGTGVAGFSGDGGPATRAQLSFPRGLDVDQAGNLYIADTNNHRVRRVGADGRIVTIAGRGLPAHEAVAFTAATIFGTNGLAFDHLGNLFFSDFDHNTIRSLGTDGYITTIAGTGNALFSGDGGHPLLASLNAPRALLFDRAGNLFFVDESNDSQVIRRITAGKDGVIDGSSDEVIRTVVGVPGAFERQGRTSTDDVLGRDAVFNSPRGIAFCPDGSLYIADWLDNRILRVSPGKDGLIAGDGDEIVSLVAGTGERAIRGNQGLAREASVAYPWWLACDSQGNLYTYEYTDQLQVIRRIDSTTGLIDIFLYTDMPTVLQLDAQDNLYYSNTVFLYRVDAVSGVRTRIAGVGTGGWSGRPGAFSGDGGDARRAEFESLQYFAIDRWGDIWIVDDGNGRLRKITFVSLRPDSAPHPMLTATP